MLKSPLIKITTPWWKIRVKAPVWKPYLLKWHDVEIMLKDSRYFPWVEKPLPCKVLFMWFYSSLFPSFYNPGYLGRGIFQSHIFFLNVILYWVFQVWSVCKTTLNLKCHTCLWKEISLWREQVYPEWVELTSQRKFQTNRFPYHLHESHWALWHDRLSVRVEECDGPHVGSSKTQASRDGRWETWGVFLELCWYWCKWWPIRWMVLFEEQYYLNWSLLCTTLISLLS